MQLGAGAPARLNSQLFERFKELADLITWRKSFSRLRVPPFILFFFAIDLALVIAHVLDYMAGNPSAILARFLDLGREGNLPTWYSSVKWFAVAELLAIFAVRNFRLCRCKSWFLLMLPLIFLAFSLDEVAAVHERLGNKINLILPGGSRQNSLFHITGIWMFVIGVPFITFFGVLIVMVKTYFRSVPDALFKIIVGTAITLGGAIGIETLANFVGHNPTYGILQVISEELCEMVGGTIALWGSYDVLHRHRFAFTVDEVELK